MLMMDDSKTVDLKIDFTSGKNHYRRLYGGGKKQALAKAIGIKSAPYPTVLDATAGLGKDAFQLASLGCQLTLIEQHPIVFEQLSQALIHAAQQAETADIMNRMNCLFGNAIDLIPNLAIHDIIYLDPMFEARQKTALVKKDMQILQKLVTTSENNNTELLEQALAYAAKRVVVKRAKSAPTLASAKPSYQLIGQSCRFDIYVVTAAR